MTADEIQQAADAVSDNDSFRAFAIKVCRLVEVDNSRFYDVYHPLVELYHGVGRRQGWTFPEQITVLYPVMKKEGMLTFNFRPGDVVSHDHLGLGKVKRNVSNYRVSVLFDSDRAMSKHATCRLVDVGNLRKAH